MHYSYPHSCVACERSRFATCMMCKSRAQRGTFTYQAEKKLLNIQGQHSIFDSHVSYYTYSNVEQYHKLLHDRLTCTAMNIRTVRVVKHLDIRHTQNRYR